VLIETLGVLLGAAAFVVGFEATMEASEAGRVEDRFEAFRSRLAFDPPVDLRRLDAGWESLSDSYMPDWYLGKGRQPLRYLAWSLIIASGLCVLFLGNLGGTVSGLTGVVVVLLAAQSGVVLAGHLHRRHLRLRIDESLSRVSLTLGNHVMSNYVNKVFPTPQSFTEVEPSEKLEKEMKLVFRWAAGSLRQALYSERHLRRFWDDKKLGGFDDVIRLYYSLLDLTGSYLLGNGGDLPLLGITKSDAKIALVDRRTRKDPKGVLVTDVTGFEGMPDEWVTAWRERLHLIGGH